MKPGIKYFLLLPFLFLFLEGFSQDKTIRLKDDTKALSEVLEHISVENNIKFAYDSDFISKIQFSPADTTLKLSEFLNMLKEAYHIHSHLIDGTWVLVYVKPEIVEPETDQLAAVPQTKYITISGYVKNRNTLENLLYCNVALPNNRGCMTNELGFFRLEIPESDSVKILISHLGYERLDTIICTQKEVQIFLKPSEIMMEAIEVKRYEKQILQASPESEKIGFNPIKANNSPRLSNDDLANALLFIPGLEFVKGGSPGLSVRGGDPNDNLVLFDGIPVLETSHLLGNISILNSMFVQQSFVSRGGFDAEYGERTSGLIELIGKSGKNRKPYLNVSANLLNTNALLNIPIGSKFSITAAWRKSIIDNWQNYLYLKLVDNNQSDAVESSIYPVLDYQDINTKLSFHPAENMEFNINFLYGDDFQMRDYTLIQSEEFYRNEWAKSKNIGYSFNWNWQINKNWFTAVTAGYGALQKELEDETGELEEVTEVIENPGKGNAKGKGKGLLKTKDRTFTREVFDIDNGINTINELRVNWNLKYSGGNFIHQAGFGWQANTFNYRFYAERTEADIPIDAIKDSLDNYYLSGFFQQKYNPVSPLSIRWGVRTNLDLYTRKFYWQPRFGIDYLILDDLNLHFSTGIYHQFLSNIKRINYEGKYNNVWFLPNEDGEGVVRSEHYILGSKYDKNGWFVNLEGYYKNASGKLLLLPVLENSAENAEINYKRVKSEQLFKGIDLFIQKKHGYFNHMLAYSLSKTEEKVENVMQNNWFPGFNDRLHRIKFTEIFSWKDWSITGSWNYASGLPIVNVVDEIQNEQIERTSHFSKLDFTLLKEFHFKHFSASTGVSLLNILNRKNIVEVDYLRFASETGSLTVRSDVSALSFTPIAFVNLKLF